MINDSLIILLYIKSFLIQNQLLLSIVIPSQFISQNFSQNRMSIQIFGLNIVLNLIVIINLVLFELTII